MGEMSIGEIARHAGLRPSALRYYESIGLLPRPRRVSGARRYDPEVLQLLAGVRFAQRAGFTVPEIKRLFYGFPSSATPAERWRALAERKLSELDDLIRGAREMQAVLREGIRCGCSSFAECALVDRP